MYAVCEGLNTYVGWCGKEGGGRWQGAVGSCSCVLIADRVIGRVLGNEESYILVMVQLNKGMLVNSLPKGMERSNGATCEY